MKSQRPRTKTTHLRHTACNVIAAVIALMLAWSFIGSTTTMRWLENDALVVLGRPEAAPGLIRAGSGWL